MSRASLWPLVVDELVDVLSAAGLAGVVFDGPPPADDATALAVSVGMPTETDADSVSGRVSQVWRDAGPAPYANRQESGEVRCTAWAWTGDDFAIRALRASLAGLLDDISDALGAVTPIGIPEVTDLRVLDSVEFVQRSDERGTTVEAMFTVAYQAVFN